MKVVISGLQLGIVVALLIGPVFFTILQTSVERGFWKGALVAMGVSLSDMLFVVICYFGLVRFVQEPKFKAYMGYVGGVVLIVFGLYYLVIKSRRISQEAHKASIERKNYRYVLKGFVINALSPSVLIFWIGTISVVSLNFSYFRGIDYFIFFATVLGTVLSSDILKAFLAGKLNKLVTPRVMKILNFILGVGMIGFGIRLIYMAQKGSFV